MDGNDAGSVAAWQYPSWLCKTNCQMCFVRYDFLHTPRQQTLRPNLTAVGLSRSNRRGPPS